MSRALRLILRLLAAIMVGGTIAIGPRMYTPRLPYGARVELVVETSEAR